ncbi:hypothetical protein K7X08_038089 [Anisodus acutangulus]|uniref:Uncharacterized protein n=1 Tax=Anisodus acutangulus TaxID=402998 RepID=A0A9Q1MY57_9SOLA|nr:hypothetical protein K7X08_038089 [Anisodus acutangulus]
MNVGGVPWTNQKEPELKDGFTNVMLLCVALILLVLVCFLFPDFYSVVVTWKKRRDMKRSWYLNHKSSLRRNTSSRRESNDKEESEPSAPKEVTTPNVSDDSMSMFDISSDTEEIKEKDKESEVSSKKLGVVRENTVGSKVSKARNVQQVPMENASREQVQEIEKERADGTTTEPGNSTTLVNNEIGKLDRGLIISSV